MQIAVCDDEKDARDLYAEKVKQLCPQADLVQYASGEEVLMADRPPDILLLDIQMPGSNGMETAQRLRSAAWIRSSSLSAPWRTMYFRRLTWEPFIIW